MDETIFSESNIGKRLGKIRREESRCLLFRGKSIPLVAKLTIGRSRDNNLVIDDKMASRFHAVVQKIKNEFFLQDLNSTNGTYVNKVRVPRGKYVKLHRKDVIRIGRTEITFE
jgi:pSer/pThr/pTyr-binding forkhead associated (FHA) protein